MPHGIHKCSPRGVGPQQDALVRGVHAALQMKYLVHLSTRLAEIVASAEDKIDAIRAGSDAASTSGGTERPTQRAGGELAAALLSVRCTSALNQSRITEQCWRRRARWGCT